MTPNNRKPARWSDFDKYLKAEHLGGKTFTLTITRVEVETTHPRPGVETLAPVLYFRETGQALVLSPTNQDALAKLFGDEISAAIGQRVTLKAEAVRVAGRDLNPIRIYPATSALGQGPQAKPDQAQIGEPEDDMPRCEHGMIANGCDVDGCPHHF